MPSDEWESFSCEIETKPLSTAEAPFVGIDLGIENSAFLSDGNKIDNPRFFRSSEKKLGKAQRALSKEKKGSKERSRLGKICAKILQKDSESEKKLLPQKSREIVEKYQTKV